jgi:ferric iron reductase protein FhuF
MTQMLEAHGMEDAERIVAIATALFNDPRPFFLMRPRFYAVSSGARAQACHRRASCCIYYRLPQGSLCASCPLLPFDESVARQRRAMT